MTGLGKQGDPDHRYTYNGKEEQGEFGLGWHDYGARMYDAQLGRWNVVDPHLENYLSNSPFAYTLNNPILLTDTDGRDIDVSNLSESHQRSLALFAKTKVGRKFLAQFAIRNKVYTIGGEKFIFKTDGKRSKDMLWYQTDNLRNAAGRNHTYIWNPVKKKYVWVKEISSSDAKTIGSASTQYMGFSVIIGEHRSGDEALYTIGHESLIHVQKNAQDLDLVFQDYKNGKHDQESKESSLGTSAETILAERLLEIEGDGSDHKLFVNGESVDMETFVKELDSLYGDSRFTKMMKDDKNNSQ